jgi:hypothetical protein
VCGFVFVLMCIYVGMSITTHTHTHTHTRTQVLMPSEDPGVVPIPKPIAGGYAPGAWPKGWCHPPDAVCLSLGIKENMCGKCTKTATGFMLGISACSPPPPTHAHAHAYIHNDVYVDRGLDSQAVARSAMLRSLCGVWSETPVSATSGCCRQTPS